MAALGKLTVEIEANLAKFQQEMTKSAYITEQAMQRMQRSAEVAKSALMGLAAGAAGAFSISSIKNMITAAIDAADHLNDLSKQTGISVEELGGMGFAASLAGGNLESITSAADKLNKSIAGAAAGNKEYTAAFEAMGISVKDSSGAIKTADKVMQDLADKFKGYADGPNKVAIAQKLMGKSGAEQIALLNDGGDALRENIEYYKRYGGVSTETASKADQFNDTLAKMQLVSGAFGRTFAADLLTPLQSVADEMLRAKENSTGLASALKVVSSELGEVVRQLISGTKEAGSFSGAIATFGTINPFRSQESNIASYKSEIKSLTEAMERYKRAGSDTTAIEQSLTELGKKLKFVQGQADAAAMAANGIGRGDPRKFDPRLQPAKVDAPSLPVPKPATPANTDDPTRKLRDTALKEVENAMARQRDAVKGVNDYISEMRSQDLIDYQTYNDQMQISRDADLKAATDGYDRQIAILQAYKGKTDKLKEKADADLKIEEVRGKKDKAIQESMQKNVQVTLEQGRAQSELRKSMEDWGRQQDQNLLLMQDDVNLMGMSQVEIAKLTAARRIQLDVEEQIRRAREKGSVSDADVEGYRKQAADAIERSNAIYNAGDAKAKDPYFNMTESVRRYGEEAANVGQQIGDALTNAFRGAEDALVQFSMTGKISFGDLARSIIADLMRIQAKAAVSGIAKYVGEAAMAYFGAGDTSTRTAEMGRITAQASAAGGYDIPAGVNPITQLHESEMVLPKQHADVIRGLAAGGGSSKGLTVNITNNAQAQVETRPSADGQGIDIFINAIKNSIGEDIAYGSGPVNAAIQGRYGLRAAV